MGVWGRRLKAIPHQFKTTRLSKGVRSREEEEREGRTYKNYLYRGPRRGGNLCQRGSQSSLSADAPLRPLAIPQMQQTHPCFAGGSSPREAPPHPSYSHAGAFTSMRFLPKGYHRQPHFRKSSAPSLSDPMTCFVLF